MLMPIASEMISGSAVMPNDARCSVPVATKSAISACEREVRVLGDQSRVERKRTGDTANFHRTRNHVVSRLPPRNMGAGKPDAWEPSRIEEIRRKKDLCRTRTVHPRRTRIHRHHNPALIWIGGIEREIDKKAMEDPVRGEQAQTSDREFDAAVSLIERVHVGSPGRSVQAATSRKTKPNRCV